MSGIQQVLEAFREYRGKLDRAIIALEDLLPGPGGTAVELTAAVVMQLPAHINGKKNGKQKVKTSGLQAAADRRSAKSTLRRQQAYDLACKGKTKKEIAGILRVSEQSITNYKNQDAAAGRPWPDVRAKPTRPVVPLEAVKGTKRCGYCGFWGNDPARCDRCRKDRDA